MDEMGQFLEAHNIGRLCLEHSQVKHRSTSKIFELRSASNFPTLTRFELGDRFFC